MNLALVAIVLAIGAGGVVAVSTRETAAAAVGLAVALVAAALFADPLPSAAILGVRIVAALLAAALIRWAGRGAARQFSPLGWPGEALLATAGGVAGLGVAVGLAAVGIGDGGPGGDGTIGGADVPALTTMALLVAAGCSLLVLGIAPLAHGPLGVRRAIGLVLVTQGVLLVRVGFAGQGTELEEVARAVLLVTAAASGAALTHAATIGPATRRAAVDDDDQGDGDAQDEARPVRSALSARAARPASTRSAPPAP
ncbi:MAG: hypothetical protein ABI620_03845 [Chloroflexota bacterium]